jgi:hypothetical protein
MCLPFAGGVRATEKQRCGRGCQLTPSTPGASRPRLPSWPRWQAAGLSPLPLGQDPGPAASVGYRLSQPRRGITSVTGTSGRRDRADAHVLVR